MVAAAWSIYFARYGQARRKAGRTQCSGSLRAPFLLEVILSQAIQCDECGKTAHMTHHWHKLDGLDFCSWKCVRRFANRRIKQDREYQREKEGIECR